MAGPAKGLFPLRSVLRWFVSGFVLAGVSLLVLHALVDTLSMRVPLATLATAEIGTLLRFFVNDRWVFSKTMPSWTRLWQFHVANAGGFAIWWSATNVLSWFGVYVLLASIVAMGCSSGFNLATNFLWVWRERVRSMRTTRQNE